jgi:uncharacterized protein YndB with AHSA1/START domain
MSAARSILKSLLHYFRKENSVTATESTAIHNTFVLERNFPWRPARVFSAFAQPALKRRWYAESDQHQILEFQMDFRPGGSERFDYRFGQGHPIAGSVIANEGTFQEIAEEKRIVTTSRMSLNGKVIAVMLATLEFVPADQVASQETDLILTHQAVYIDWPDGVKMIEMGWSHLLERVQKVLAE